MFWRLIGTALAFVVASAATAQTVSSPPAASAITTLGTIDGVLEGDGAGNVSAAPTIGTGALQRGIGVDTYGSDAAAATSALAAAAAAKQPAIYSSSSYSFATPPTGDNVLQYGWQTTFTGESPPGANNGAVEFAKAFEWRSATMTAVGTAGQPGSANQWGEFLSFKTSGVPAVSSLKAPILVWMEQDVASDYGASVFNDASTMEKYAVCAATNAFCRIYGDHIHVKNANTGAGYFGSGLEIEMQNLGTAQTSWGTTTSNTGLSLVAYAGVTTGAMSVTAGSGSFSDGLYFSPSAVTNAVIRFGSDNAEWRADGTLRIGAGVDGATLAAPAAYASYNHNGYDFLAQKPVSGNAAAQFNGGGAGAQEYATFIYAGAKATSIGYDNATRRFVITGQEGLGGSKYVEFDDTGVSKFFANLSAPKHLSTGSAPTLSTCGTSPSISANSTDMAGEFTTGTGTPTACTVTFAAAYPNAAFCTVTPASNYTGTYYVSAQSNSAFTVTLGTGTDSVAFNYTCGGN